MAIASVDQPYNIRNGIKLKTIGGAYSTLILSNAAASNKTWNIPNTTATSLTFAQVTEAQTFTGAQMFSDGVKIKESGASLYSVNLLSSTLTADRTFTFPNTNVNSYTGTGDLVLSTAPTFTTSILSPIVYGSAADNGDLELIGTSSATKTTSYINFGASGAHGNISCAAGKWTIGSSATTVPGHLIQSGVANEYALTVQSNASATDTRNGLLVTAGTGAGFTSDYAQKWQTAGAVELGYLRGDGKFVVGIANSAGVAGVEHVLRTGDQGLTRTYTHGEIHFCNGSSTLAVPTISASTDDANAAGLQIQAAGNGAANSLFDMQFNVRKNTNADFDTIDTSKAFVFSRFATELMSLTRAGACTLGASAGLTTSHLIQNSSTTSGNYITNFKKLSTNANTANTLYVSFEGADTTDGYIGNVGTTLTLADSSDVRKKENITEYTKGLNEVLKLRAVNYCWKLGGASSFGFIAQEVKGCIPEAVSVIDESDRGGFSDSHYLSLILLIPAMVKSIQELNAKIVVLEAKLNG